MNTKLEALFEEYNVSKKDRHEIWQIYSFLPVEKQKKLLQNFWILIFRLQKIEEDIQIEREILIGDALNNIQAVVKRVESEIKEKKIKEKIDVLKSEL